MKSLKIALASVTLVVAVIALSSFAAKYDSAAFTRVCYSFIGSNPTTPTAAEIQDPQNWQVFTSAPSESVIENTLCLQSSKLCIICFDDANTSFADATAILASYVSGGGLISALPDPTTRTNGAGTKSVKVFQFN